ncbi:Rep family protein [Lactococcus protaetiae]|uniref:Plasmid replication protein origin binding domain-containing protein n=1 Tax=Lactococcus protaetiae TaxID=2592653 RepID=A0A514Z6E5_9LACT|nr:Rep family protein [Lactococcus protaetiae]QDK70164.1 hypothetical protein FLP15_01945 [Lactococcus protaetiae]
MENEVKDDENLRGRNWFIQVNYYYETHNSEGLQVSNVSQEEWKNGLTQRIKSIISERDSVAWIFHSKDILKDGMPKPLHCHILFMFKNARYQNSLMKDFGITRKENCKPVRAKSSVARYLTHRTSQAMDDGKYQYNVDEVQTINCDYTELIKHTTDKKQEQANLDEFIASLDVDIQNGRYWREAHQALKEMYGAIRGEKYWHTYKKRFEDDYKEYLYYKARDFERHGRELTTVFAWSKETGVGKSQLMAAMAYALTDRVHKIPPHGKGKTYDFAGMYEGEIASIMNEAEGKALDNKEFLGLADRFEFTAVNSRNFDKYWLALFLFITATESYDEFVTALLPKFDESDDFEKRQLKRREIMRRLPWEIVCTKTGRYQARYEIKKLDERTYERFTVAIIDCEDVRKGSDEIAKAALKALEVIGAETMIKTEKDFAFLKEKIKEIED